jgi:hypothetical protein
MMEPVAQGSSIPRRTGDQSAANGGGVLMAMRCLWDGHGTVWAQDECKGE